MKKLFYFFILFGQVAFSQSIDVQKYHLDITVSDNSDIIKVQEKIRILFTKSSSQIILDLVLRLRVLKCFLQLIENYHLL